VVPKFIFGEIQSFFSCSDAFLMMTSYPHSLHEIQFLSMISIIRRF